MSRCPNKSKRVAAQCYFADGHGGRCNFGRDHKPLTLADVRAHIERRIQECRDERDQWTHGAETRAVIRELTEALAMLDRVQADGAGAEVRTATKDQP